MLSDSQLLLRDILKGSLCVQAGCKEHVNGAGNVNDTLCDLSELCERQERRRKMSHEVETMMYVGDTPWHGLGQQVDPNTPLEAWAKIAHLDWEIEEAAATFFDPESGEVRVIPNRKVLLRSDSREYLSTMYGGYETVQPKEILEFFQDLIESGGFRLHTAGSMFNGRRMWALAEIGESARILGQDKIDGYLLLADVFFRGQGVEASGPDGGSPRSQLQHLSP